MGRGGRRSTTWTKATRPKGGRKKGSKDKVPRTWKGAMKIVFEDIASQETKLLYDVVIKGLKGQKAFHFLNLMTAYIDGRPTDAVPADQVRGMVRDMLRLFLDVVHDTALRRRYLEGVNQLIHGAPVVDAQSLPPK